ncbi:MAG TPA: SDR family NAD(P)-dependent oxidoreductase [Polyangia bacterium]
MGLCDGKVVIITGAGGGLGRAYALALAREGAKVVVNDVGGSRDGQGGGNAMADQVVAEIRAAGGAAVASYDSVSTMAGAEGIVKTATTTFGHLDALVNNAGILRDKTLLKMTEEMWDAVIAVHLKGTFACTLAAANAMKGSGGGSIINTSSYAGLRGNYGQSNYAAAKAGIYGFTLVTAMELGKAGIRVNALAPMAKTRMTEDISMVPAAMTPDRVAPLVTFLVSDLSKDVNGHIFGVHGGQLFEYRMQMTDGATQDAWTPAAIARRLPEISGAATAAPAAAPAPAPAAQAAAPAAAVPTTPAEKIAASFKYMPAGFVPEKAGGWNAVMHWEIAGAGDFTITVADGQCTSAPGKAGTPTCVVKTDAPTFVGIGEGTVDGQQAYMQGKISATNVGDLMKYRAAIDPAKARAAFEAALAAAPAVTAPPAAAPAAPTPAAPAAAPAPTVPKVPSAAEQALDGMDPLARLKLLFGLLPAVGQAQGRTARVHVTAGDLALTVVADGAQLDVEAGHTGAATSRLVAEPAALWSLLAGAARPAALFAEARVTSDSMDELRWLLRAAGPKVREELVAEINARGAGMNRAGLGKLYHGQPAVVKLDDVVGFAVATNDQNPHYVDLKRPGGVIAPPLFPVKFCNQMYFQVFNDASLKVDLARLLFGEMELRFFAPVHPRDIVAAKSQVIGLEDKDTGQILTVRTRLITDGEARCEADAAFFVRWAKKGRLKALKAALKDGAAKEAAPEVAFEEPMQARDDQTNLFARAADDPNPIHVDESFAKAVGLPGRILHGLCTMSFCGQAFVQRACAGDPARLLRLKVRFAKPARPGQIITTRAFAPTVTDGVRHYRFVAVNDAGETVITAGEAEVRA